MVLSIERDGTYGTLTSLHFCSTRCQNSCLDMKEIGYVANFILTSSAVLGDQDERNSNDHEKRQ